MKGERRVRAILQKASSILMLLLVLCACDSTLFHSFRSVQNGWCQGDALTYACDGLNKNKGMYGMYLEARTTARYRYKNLVVRAEYRDVCDSLLYVDTIPLVIYSDDGRHVGASAGLLYQQRSEMRLLNFSAGDSLCISLSHMMPDDILDGVIDVGVKIVALD